MKMAFFSLDSYGLSQLEAFQQDNLILSHRQYSVLTDGYRPKPHIGVQYAPKSEAQQITLRTQPKGEADGDIPTNKPGKANLVKSGKDPGK